MKTSDKYEVYFLINENAHLLDFAGPCQVFHEASERTGKFELHYVSFKSYADCHQGLVLGCLKKPPDKLPPNAIVVVCASKYHSEIYGDIEAEKSIHWLQSAIRDDTFLLGICTGSFLLGKAGLLDNRECTTHHSLTDKLAQQFPKAEVVADRIYLQDGNIYTTAGVTSGIDLCLHIVERLLGSHSAIEIARDLVVHRRRMANDPQFSSDIKYRNHVSPLINSVQDYIGSNYKQCLSTVDISDRFNVSQRHLQRLFKEYTGITMKDYITRVRLEEAKGLVENGNTIEQSAYASGFSQISTFRAAWRKHFSELPTAYKKSSSQD